jgi:hypothetical protein
MRYKAYLKLSLYWKYLSVLNLPSFINLSRLLPCFPLLFPPHRTLNPKFRLLLSKLLEHPIF